MGAPKSFLFTESSLVVKIKNLLVKHFHVFDLFLFMVDPISGPFSIEGCCKNDNSCYILSIRLKGFSV